jgi:hypothetical protein
LAGLMQAYAAVFKQHCFAANGRHRRVMAQGA